MGRKKCREPDASSQPAPSHTLYRCIQSRTVTVVRTRMPTPRIILSNILTVAHGVLGTFRSCELIVTSAKLSILVVHLPLPQATHSHIFPKQHVETGIDIFHQVVANKDNGIESFQYHADFGCRIPPVMTASRGKGRIETVTATAAHSCKKCCSVGAVVYMLIRPASDWWSVNVSGGDAAFLMTFEMVEEAKGYR